MKDVEYIQVLDLLSQFVRFTSQYFRTIKPPFHLHYKNYPHVDNFQRSLTTNNSSTPVYYLQSCPTELLGKLSPPYPNSLNKSPGAYK